MTGKRAIDIRPELDSSQHRRAGRGREGLFFGHRPPEARNQFVGLFGDGQTGGADHAGPPRNLACQVRAGFTKRE